MSMVTWLLQFLYQYFPVLVVVGGKHADTKNPPFHLLVPLLKLTLATGNGFRVCYNLQMFYHGNEEESRTSE